LNGEEELPDLVMQGPVVIILGSEETGISRQLLDQVHHRFRIPQVGSTQSLNVSVAAGIILYHALLHRKK
jgi:tRNA G18 (ribose-2'-O)-methylase SpoU